MVHAYLGGNALALRSARVEQLELARRAQSAARAGGCRVASRDRLRATTTCSKPRQSGSRDARRSGQRRRSARGNAARSPRSSASPRSASRSAAAPPRRSLRAWRWSSTSMLPVDAPMNTFMPQASLRARAFDLLEVRVRRAEVEAVVHVAGRRRDALLRRQRRAIDGRRIGVRHVEEARDAAAERPRATRVRERRLMGEAGLAAVHLIVDRSPGASANREDRESRLALARARCRPARCDRLGRADRSRRIWPSFTSRALTSNSNAFAVIPCPRSDRLRRRAPP